MTEISKNNGMMAATRGDDFSIRISIYAEDGSLYALNDKDEIYVGIMEPRESFEGALIRKRFTKDDVDADGMVRAIMASKDTECLLPGIYFVQAKLRQYVSTTESGTDLFEITTVLPKTKFVLMD